MQWDTFDWNRLGDWVLKAELLTHWTTYLHSTDCALASKWPLTLNVRSILYVLICYAVTISRSRGQTLDRVGIYRRKPVFSHGQLYFAISKVTSREGVKFLIQDNHG
jgi:hypothetical protein